MEPLMGLFHGRGRTVQRSGGLAVELGPGLPRRLDLRRPKLLAGQLIKQMVELLDALTARVLLLDAIAGHSFDELIQGRGRHIRIGTPYVRDALRRVSQAPPRGEDAGEIGRSHLQYAVDRSTAARLRDLVRRVPGPRVVQNGGGVPQQVEGPLPVVAQGAQHLGQIRGHCGLKRSGAGGGLLKVHRATVSGTPAIHCDPPRGQAQSLTSVAPIGSNTQAHRRQSRRAEGVQGRARHRVNVLGDQQRIGRLQRSRSTARAT